MRLLLSLQEQDHARIIKEYEESRKRIEAMIAAERQKQSELLHTRLNKRRAKVISRKQLELAGNMRKERDLYTRKAAGVARNARMSMMRSALTRARGVQRAHAALKRLRSRAAKRGDDGSETGRISLSAAASAFSK